MTFLEVPPWVWKAALVIGVLFVVTGLLWWATREARR